MSVPTQTQDSLSLDNFPEGGSLSTRPSAQWRSSSRASCDSWSQSSEDSSSACSTYGPLEGDQIRDLFSALKNLTIGRDSTLETPAPAIRLTFDPRQSNKKHKTQAHKHTKSRSLTLDDQLNPSALPFIPTGIVTGELPPRCASPELMLREDRRLSGDLYEVISTHSPHNPDGEYVRPPGLPIPISDCTIPSERHKPFDPQTSTRLPCWYRSFTAGTDPAIDVQIRMYNAHAAVSSNPNWSEDKMEAFAGKFASQAYMTTETPGDTIAEFALCVFNAFGATHGAISAQSFLWSLQQHAIHAFTTSWDTASLDPSLHHSAGLSDQVIRAISLARFIGDLFKYGLLSRTHVSHCVSKILENPCAEEHIVALGYLVVRSGPVLWMATPMQLDTEGFKTFLKKLKILVSSVKYSLVDGKPGYSDVWVGEVEARFAEWEAYYADYRSRRSLQL